jgi:hypothetical protein
MATGVSPTIVECVPLQSRTLADLQSVVDRVGKRAPELTSRAYRAGILLASGAVTPIRADLYEVRGTEPRPYAVDVLAETCSCADFQHAAPEFKGARWCKHRLSVLFLRHLAAKQVARQAERRTRVPVFRAAQPKRQRPARVHPVARLSA